MGALSCHFETLDKVYNLSHFQSFASEEKTSAAYHQRRGSSLTFPDPRPMKSNYIVSAECVNARSQPQAAIQLAKLNLKRQGKDIEQKNIQSWKKNIQPWIAAIQEGEVMDISRCLFSDFLKSS